MVLTIFWWNPSHYPIQHFYYFLKITFKICRGPLHSHQVEPWSEWLQGFTLHLWKLWPWEYIKDRHTKYTFPIRRFFHGMRREFLMTFLASLKSECFAFVPKSEGHTIPLSMSWSANGCDPITRNPWAIPTPETWICWSTEPVSPAGGTTAPAPIHPAKTVLSFRTPPLRIDRRYTPSAGLYKFLSLLLSSLDPPPFASGVNERFRWINPVFRVRRSNSSGETSWWMVCIQACICFSIKNPF